jgi:hypothetical protein
LWQGTIIFTMTSWCNMIFAVILYIVYNLEKVQITPSKNLSTSDISKITRKFILSLLAVSLP